MLGELTSALVTLRPSIPWWRKRSAPFERRSPMPTTWTRQGAVAHVLSYMGDIADDEPDRVVRGIQVAVEHNRLQMER